MRRIGVRIVFCLLFIFAAAELAIGVSQQSQAPPQQTVAPPSDGITVATTNVQNHHEIVAWNASGGVIYYNNTHDLYFDVDPSPAGERTVMYVAADLLDPQECEANVRVCVRNVIERVNLTTGDVTRIHTRIAPGRNGWHDVDRIGKESYLVGEIGSDRAFVYNTSRGVTTWAYHVQRDYPLSKGGIYPDDWTHLNDVELLDDGRVMLSLRNFDQVIFVDMETGERTGSLGSDENHDVLFEQHNPDYIPRRNGGPAVVVADSENGRIVEYQRTTDGWARTWVWQDTQLQWPRDADRLPNGNTLITDTHGGRVIEVAPNGSIVWSVQIAGAYEAERLGSGAESAGGKSAKQLDLRTVTAEKEALGDEDSGASGPLGFLRQFLADDVREAIPSILLNSLIWITPSWIGYRELILLAGMAGIVSVWSSLEAYWAGYRLRSPIKRNRVNRDES